MVDKSKLKPIIDGPLSEWIPAFLESLSLRLGILAWMDCSNYYDL